MKSKRVKNGYTKLFDGREAWFKDDKLHREDGPAIKYPNRSQFWYLFGKLHREDGPAAVYPDLDVHWYLNGQFLGLKEPENWDELVRIAQVKIIMES